MHRDHEEVATILDGRGVFVLGERAYPVKTGSVMIIPRGTVHSFEAKEPTTVLAVFSPPFDPADRIFPDGPTP
jgi:quercetin dioxygenase-like cupin family protein